jgi:hypothetical protein
VSSVGLERADYAPECRVVARVKTLACIPLKRSRPDPYETFVTGSFRESKIGEFQKGTVTDERPLVEVRSTGRCNTLTFEQEVECYGPTSEASPLYSG